MFPIFIRSGTTVTEWSGGIVTLPVVPPIVGPCNILMGVSPSGINRLGVYDCDSGELTTQYRLNDGVLTVNEQEETNTNLHSLSGHSDNQALIDRKE
jgi:hypothetical protein